MLDILYDMDEYGSKFLVEVLSAGKLVYIYCVPKPINIRKFWKFNKSSKPVVCYIPLDSPTKINELFKLIQMRQIYRLIGESK